MNTAASNFKPGVLGGALRKGLQSPDSLRIHQIPKWEVLLFRSQ